ELGADFQLALACNLVVMHFNGNALLLEQQAHFGAHILETIYRGYRHISAFQARPMSLVAAIHVDGAGPRGFVGLDLDETTRHVVIPGNSVKDKEFRLGTEVSGIAQAAG